MGSRRTNDVSGNDNQVRKLKHSPFNLKLHFFGTRCLVELNQRSPFLQTRLHIQPQAQSRNLSGAVTPQEDSDENPKGLLRTLEHVVAKPKLHSRDYVPAAETILRLAASKSSIGEIPEFDLLFLWFIVVHRERVGDFEYL